MLRSSFGNLIFAIIARMMCGNHLNGFMSVHTTNSPSLATVEHEVKRTTVTRKKLQGAPVFIVALLLTRLGVN